MGFVSLHEPKATPFLWSKLIFTRANLLLTIRDNFTTTTLLLFGALIQTALTLSIGNLALYPAALWLLYKVIDVYAIKTGLKRNVLMDGVLTTKFTAQFPDAFGDHGDKAAKDDICILIVGAKANSPLGLFEPGAKALADSFQGMVAHLEENPDKYGFLGSTNTMGAERSSNNATIVIMYFRSYQGVQSFALSPIHRDAWNWWNTELVHNKKLGVWHEMYQVPAGAYETVYANVAPIGAAATMHRVRNSDKKAKWVSPVVESTKGLLRTSAGRMNMGKGGEHLGFGLKVTDPYETSEC